MVIVSLEIVDVSLQLVLCIFNLLFISVVFLESVAFVVPTCGLTMFFPRAKTDPTEFISAFSALHVVASLVLLDWTTAVLVRALFGMRNYPSDIFTLTAVFQAPLSNHLAACWSVKLIATFEAIGFSAETIDVGGAKCIRDFLTCILAITIWTPLHTPIVISKGLTMPLFVSI